MRDEISFDYYAKNCVNETSKSYPCRHGVVEYHNGMICEDLSIVYKKGQEYVVSTTTTNTRTGEGGKSYTKLYLQFIENVGKYSSNTINNFLQYKKTLKKRLYSTEEFKKMKAAQLRSTRADRGKINVGGIEYYAAINLNLTEFIKTISDRIPDDEKKYFFLRVSGYSMDLGLNIVEKQEQEYETFEGNDKVYSVNIVDEIRTISQNVQSNNRESVPRKYEIDFEKLNKTKMKRGEIGEWIVYNIEKERLEKAEKKDLADKVKIVSKDISLGYDIVSFLENGEEIHIEVKTTVSNIQDGFYISKNEKEKMNTLVNYYIYRLYNLKQDKLTADLFVYRPDSFDVLEFEAVSYYVKAK